MTKKIIKKLLSCENFAVWIDNTSTRFQNKIMRFESKRKFYSSTMGSQVTKKTLGVVFNGQGQDKSVNKTIKEII